MNSSINKFNNSISTETIESFLLTDSSFAGKPNIKLSTSKKPVTVNSESIVIKKNNDSVIRNCEKKDKVMFVSHKEIEEFLATKPDEKILEKQRKIAFRFVACK